jgi:hypothetical protein
MDLYKNKKNGYLVSILYQVPILFYNAITQFVYSPLSLV